MTMYKIYYYNSGQLCSMPSLKGLKVKREYKDELEAIEAFDACVTQYAKDKRPTQILLISYPAPYQSKIERVSGMPLVFDRAGDKEDYKKTDWYYCTNCDKHTIHECTYKKYQVESLGDTFVCLDCHWIYCVTTGVYHAPPGEE